MDQAFRCPKREAETRAGRYIEPFLGETEPSCALGVDAVRNELGKRAR